MINEKTLEQCPEKQMKKYFIGKYRIEQSPEK
jgi:hypothetical protein